MRKKTIANQEFKARETKVLRRTARSIIHSPIVTGVEMRNMESASPSVVLRISIRSIYS